MAGTFTHWMVVEAALEKYPEPGDPRFAAIMKRYAFVTLGAIGPDYPYLSELLGNILRQHSWADRMHYENTGRFVACGVRNLAGLAPDAREVCTAFLFGFATHLLADAIVHPVVNLAVSGLPLWNGNAHRRCEMTQDSWIFKRITNNEIRDSDYVGRLRLCSDPADKDNLQPALREFWRKTLSDAHPAAGAWYGRIDPDAWHRHVLLGMGEAATPMPILRHLGEDKKVVYQPSNDLPAADRAAFVDAVKLPGGRVGAFKEDVFDKVVAQVLDVWRRLLGDVEGGRADAVEAYLRNWDLDRGVDLDGLALW